MSINYDEKSVANFMNIFALIFFFLGRELKHLGHSKRNNLFKSSHVLILRNFTVTTSPLLYINVITPNLLSDVLDVELVVLLFIHFRFLGYMAPLCTY
jgi:hypothetical protein